MEKSELFKKLDKLNPTKEQLQAYIELMEKLFPLPLYVQLPDGSHAITRELSENMRVAGIATESGVFLLEPIHPSSFATPETTVADLFAEAAKIHPDARPLVRNDVLGESTAICDLLDDESKFWMTVHLLSKKGVVFFGDFPSIALFGDNFAMTDRSMILHNLAGHADTLPLSYIATVYLFVPVEKILMQDLKSHTKKHGLCTGIGIDGCDFPEPQPEKDENSTAQSSAGEDEKFPLSLFLRDEDGNEYIANSITGGCTVEGIVLRDTVILRQTIKPCEIEKDNPTIDDLNSLAKEIHPLAEPIYWKGFWGGGIATLLLVDRKRYNQTAEMLRKRGVIMPNINQEISFVGAAMQVVESEKTWVTHIYFDNWMGGGKIRFVEEMMLAIPREKIDPFH